MSFPRYPKYKESGVEWLGEVPEHWCISRLGFESWVRARLGWKGLKAEEYVDAGYAFLATPNIKGTKIDFENVNFITQERYDESPEIKLQAGDVLLAKDGSTLGTVNVVRKLPRPSTVNSSIAVITPGNRLNGVFLYHLFGSSFMEQIIQRTKGGMGVPHLFQEDLNKFYLPLPPLFEQAAIVAFLDREIARTDALVAEQQRLMELLKEKRQAVISHAVTKGLNPHAPMKDSGIEWLGEVPAHWEHQRLSTICDFQSGKAHEPFIEDGGEFVCVNSRFISTEGKSVKFCSKNLSPARRNDILLVMSDLPSGRALAKAFFVEDDTPYAVNQRVCRLTPRHACARFLFFLLDRNSIFLSHDDGINQTHLPNEVFTKFPVFLPPMSEQEEIAAFLTIETLKFDTLSDEAETVINLLQERRTALISAAVTGQIDVRQLADKQAAA